MKYAFDLTETQRNLMPFQSINKNPIEIVKCANILGVHVYNNLKWNNQVHKIIEKAQKRLFSLWKPFKKI